MNIILKTASGHITVRPDTTWEKDNEDIFVPDSVSGLSWTPVFFTRICKPGKSVLRKFAGRYFDTFNYGVLLYPEEFLDGSEEGFACASCLDHTSFLPSPMFPNTELGNEGNILTVNKDREKIYSTHKGALDMFIEAVEEASSRIYMRTGDLLAIELAPRTHLASRGDGNPCITGTYHSNTIIDFTIHF